MDTFEGAGQGGGVGAKAIPGIGIELRHMANSVVLSISAPSRSHPSITKG